MAVWCVLAMETHRITGRVSLTWQQQLPWEKGCDGAQKVFLLFLLFL